MKIIELLPFMLVPIGIGTVIALIITFITKACQSLKIAYEKIENESTK
jgi:hypothetical protein